MLTYRVLVGWLAAVAWLAVSQSFAASPEIISKGQAALDAAAQANKYCFLLFYKTNDAATQAAATTLSKGVANRADRTSYAFVAVSDPNEQALVKQFNVGRAAMPFTIAVAPNGAVTSVYPKPITDPDLDTAFVTPGMARVMKQMQSGKSVLVCVHTPAVTLLPVGVSQFVADPHFAGRTAIVAVRVDDPAEAKFVKDLEIDPRRVAGTTVVFLAPPGVLVGKYSGDVSMASLASDLHAAGKCCDDPNCKHNHK